MTQNIKDTSEFKNFVELISVYTAAQHDLDQLENDANKAQLEIVDDSLSDYTRLQQTITKTEEALQLIALKNPEWFGGKASIKTPYGTVKFTPSTSLDVVNEELSIELIERDLATSMTARPSDYIRVSKQLNREALEALTDAELEKYKIKRVSKKTFSVAAAKLDMGKAVKARQEQPENRKQAKAA
jgi:hypothetical protein